MTTPILVVAFGAMSRQARGVYELLDADLRTQYPERNISWAYTATSIVSRLKTRGERAQTLAEAMEAFKQQGEKHLQVLSLHLVPGEKHQEVLDADGLGMTLTITRPLLDGPESIQAVAQNILQDLPQDRPVLVVAHGHGHETRYNQELFALKAALKASRPDLHLALLEGDVDTDGLEAFIQKAKAQDKAHIYPFLYVAGDHVQNDILGDEEDSFKSRLGVSDFSCGEALGYRAWVRKRLVEKLCNCEDAASKT